MPEDPLSWCRFFLLVRARCGKFKKTPAEPAMCGTEDVGRASALRLGAKVMSIARGLVTSVLILIFGLLTATPLIHIPGLLPR